MSFIIEIRCLPISSQYHIITKHRNPEYIHEVYKQGLRFYIIYAWFLFPSFSNGTPQAIALKGYYTSPPHIYAVSFSLRYSVVVTLLHASFQTCRFVFTKCPVRLFILIYSPLFGSLSSRTNYCVTAKNYIIYYPSY